MLTRLKHQEEGVRQILTSANLNAKQENRHFFMIFAQFDQKKLV